MGTLAELQSKHQLLELKAQLPPTLQTIQKLLMNLSLTFFFMLLHVMTDVTMNDRGLYSCNLHHLYCNLYEMVRVQLNVTKSRTYDTKCRLPLR